MKQIKLATKPRRHSKVDRDEELDLDWNIYYEQLAKLQTWKEDLIKRTSQAIADGKTLYNVTWVSPSFRPDHDKMEAFYKTEEWLIPTLLETDWKSMTQAMKDEEVEKEDYCILRKGFPQKPRGKKK